MDKGKIVNAILGIGNVAVSTAICFLGVLVEAITSRVVIRMY